MPQDGVLPFFKQGLVLGPPRESGFSTSFTGRRRAGRWDRSCWSCHGPPVLIRDASPKSGRRTAGAALDTRCSGEGRANMDGNVKKPSKRRLSACACILLVLICGLGFRFRRFPALFPLLEGEGKPVYNVWIYHNPGVSGFDIEAEIPDQQIEELLASAPVRRGASFRAIPCPAFEIYVTFEDKFYELAVGKNGLICVNGSSFHDSADSETFWADAGELFSALYACHISAGGEPIPSMSSG